MPRLVVGDTMTWYYLLGALILLNLSQSFYGMSHGAWAAELSTEYHERSRVMAYGEWVSAIGGFSVFAVPIYYEIFVDSSLLSPRVEAMCWVAMALIPVTVLLAVTTVPERYARTMKRMKFWAALKIILSNPHMIRVALIDTLIGLQNGVLGALYIFLLQYVVQAPWAPSTILMINNAAHLIIIPVYVKVARRIGKHRAVGISILFTFIHCVGYAFVGAGDVALFASMAIVSGFGMVSAGFLFRSMTVDIVDYDHVQSGEERTALFFSVLSTTTRIAPTLAGAILFPFLAFFGFDPGVREPDSFAIAAMRWTYVLFPAVCAAAAGLLIWGFKLDEQAQIELRRAIEEREAEMRAAQSGVEDAGQRS